MPESPAARKRRLLRKRDKYRTTVCAGCRHNYYNWPKPASPRGDVAVADDYYCWHLPEARAHGCVCYHT